MSIIHSKQTEFNEPISLIICARNESNNLIKHLPSLLSQNYPNYEVIVVNDRSLDDTEDILRAYEQKYSNFRHTIIKETRNFNFNKKFALTIGIKAAKNEHLVFTDADCFPKSPNWLRNIVAPFGNDKSICVGYGGYIKTKGLLNKIIRAETFLIAQQYFGLGKLGIPYMSVGRNFAYNKKLFFKNKGFSNHQHINSGDDDLFMSENASTSNTDFVFNKEAYTLSVPEKNWKSYLEQKRRHLTTSTNYKFKTKLALFLISLINYTYIAFTVYCLTINHLNKAATISLLLVLCFSTIVSYKALKTTKSLDLLPCIFISDIFILFFYPIAFTINYIKSGNFWRNY